jgi:hypothetical protein
MVVKPDSGDSVSVVAVPAVAVPDEGASTTGEGAVARVSWWRRRFGRVPVWLLLVVFALVAVVSTLAEY